MKGALAAMLFAPSASASLLRASAGCGYSGCTGRDIADCSLGACAGLGSMELSGQSLSGVIPDLGAVAETLTGNALLDNNLLTGTIPVTLCALNELDTLSVGANALEGPIPSCIGVMAGLTVFAAWSNGLTGTVPASLGDSTTLQGLYMDQNSLTGSIPPTIGSIGSLTHLALWQNDLTGALPSSVGSLANLAQLFADHNSLGGTLPPSIGSLESLTYLALHDNQITGQLPASIGSLTNLRSMFLSNNAFTGSVPSALCPVFESLESCTAGEAFVDVACPAQCSDTITTKCLGACASVFCDWKPCANPSLASCWEDYMCGDYVCTKTDAEALVCPLAVGAEVKVAPKQAGPPPPSTDEECEAWVATDAFALVVLKAGADKAGFVANQVYTDVAVGDRLYTAVNDGARRAISHLITCVPAVAPAAQVSVHGNVGHRRSHHA